MAQETIEENLKEIGTLLATRSMLLLLCQWVIEIVCTTLIAMYLKFDVYQLFYLNMVVAFLIGNTCLLFTSLLIKKEILHAPFEKVYNIAEGILLFSASTALLISVIKSDSSGTSPHYHKTTINGEINQLIVLSVLGMIIVALSCVQVFILSKEA